VGLNLERKIHFRFSFLKSNMNKRFFQFILVVVAIVSTVFLSHMALADTEMIPIKISGGTMSCVGRYYAYAKMTNDVGSIWIKPPTNIVVRSGTLTDISRFPSPYSSYAVVQPFGGTLSCASNSVTFSATNTQLYELTIFVANPPPPPTNGQFMTLQIQWQ
jgi:hypothetical protein